MAKISRYTVVVSCLNFAAYKVLSIVLRNLCGYYNSSSQIVGQVGTVRGVQNSGDVVVIVKGQLCELNPLCLALAPDAKPPEVPSMYCNAYKIFE